MINKCPLENNVLIGVGDHEANRPQEVGLRCLVVRPSSTAFLQRWADSRSSLIRPE